MSLSHTQAGNSSFYFPCGIWFLCFSPHMQITYSIFHWHPYPTIEDKIWEGGGKCADCFQGGNWISAFDLLKNS